MAESRANRGLSLGRIAGIDVQLHWTWWITATLIPTALASGVFPQAVAGRSETAYLTMGLVTAVLFFASLLLHELGHALEARRAGIPTDGITLWMLGGIARSGGSFPSPGIEARVAVAGPVVSAVLGVAFVAAGHIGGLTGPVAAVLEWVGWTNLILLGFNMTPALPLDGGRVLRALLWRLSGSLVTATRAASRASRALSAALITVGLAGALLGAAFGGLWLALIGWFTFSAAGAERRAVEAQVVLGGLHVADVMTPDPTTVTPGASAGDLLELRRRTGHLVYPVIDESGDAIGLVSVLAAERLPQRRRDWVSVRDLLADAPLPLALDADAELLPAVLALAGNPLQSAAVIRAGRLVGMLSLTDISRAVLRRAGSQPR
jgi:Zn-dependent protease